MSNTAPKPPTSRLLAAACVTGGTTLGMLAITVVGGFIYGNILTPRLIAYSLAVLIGTMVSGWLGARYAVQKHRRDAWWDGFAAGDEPLAEVVNLRTVKELNGDVREWRADSPS